MGSSFFVCTYRFSYEIASLKKEEFIAYIYVSEIRFDSFLNPFFSINPPGYSWFS